jgi:hypothetical protein
MPAENNEIVLATTPAADSKSSDLREMKSKVTTPASGAFTGRKRSHDATVAQLQSTCAPAYRITTVLSDAPNSRSAASLVGNAEYYGRAGNGATLLINVCQLLHS